MTCKASLALPASCRWHKRDGAAGNKTRASQISQSEHGLMTIAALVLASVNQGNVGSGRPPAICRRAAGLRAGRFPLRRAFHAASVAYSRRPTT
jgi:hypothetical protein